MKFQFLGWRGSLNAKLASSVFLLLSLFGLAFAQSGSISGFVYEDMNDNGMMDIGEMPMPNFQLNVVDPSVRTEMMTTGPDGRYHFNVSPGRVGILPAFDQSYEVTGPRGKGEPYFTNVAPGQNVTGIDWGVHRPCARFSNIKILCDTSSAGGYIIKFDYTNLSNFPVSHLFIMNQPPVVVNGIVPLSGTPNYIPFNPAIPPGGTVPVTIHVAGGVPMTQLCLEFEQDDAMLMNCCNFEWCFDLPNCDCFQILDETIECNPDGTYTWCFTIQSLVPPSVSPMVSWLFIAPPAGVNMSQAVFPLNPPLAYGQTKTICVTLSGVSAGKQYCFQFGMRDFFFRLCCAAQVCVTMPLCDCLTPGECDSHMPQYFDAAGALVQSWAPMSTKTVAAVTSDGLYNSSFTIRYPLKLMNLDNYQTATPPQGAIYSPVPAEFVGPSVSADTTWTLSQLGTLFGVCFDSRGHIFTSASSSYNQFAFIGSGNSLVEIFKIENGTGKVIKWVVSPQIPQSITANPGGGSAMPAFGNVTFDGMHDQLFTTSFEDGKIYRITGLNNPVGSVQADVFDPWGADNGAAGFAPRGERIWGVQWHNNRVYFSRWVKDSSSTNDKVDNLGNPITHNEIWSVGLDGTGKIAAGTLQKEVDMPYLPGSTWSSPVSDIQFSPLGKMMCAERMMTSDTGVYSHSSRGIEFTCDAGGWVPSGGANDLYFQIGTNPIGGPFGDNFPRSAAGGTDYDYSQASTVGDPTSGARVWFTGDRAGYYSIPGNNAGICYGLTGLPMTGGGPQQALLINLFAGKSSMGDVEIPCPDHTVLMHVQLGDYSASISQVPLHVKLCERGSGTVVQEATVHLDAHGEARFVLDSMLPPGEYDICTKGSTWLRRRVELTGLENQSVSMMLINGDVNNDNEVSLADFGILSGAFGSFAGDSRFVPGADLDGDGEVGLSDFGILSANFGEVGD